MNRRQIVTAGAAAAVVSLAGVPALAAPQALRDLPIRSIKVEKDVVMRAGKPFWRFFMHIKYVGGPTDRIDDEAVIAQATRRLAQQAFDTYYLSDDLRASTHQFALDVADQIEKRRT